MIDSNDNKFQLGTSLERVRTVLHPCVWALASVFLMMAPDRALGHVVVRVVVLPTLRRPLRTPHPCWRGCRHPSGITRYSPGQSRYLITSPTLKLPHSTSRVQPDIHDQKDQARVLSSWCAMFFDAPRCGAVYPAHSGGGSNVDLPAPGPAHPILSCPPHHLIS